jgi:hypothetical protein
LSGFSRIKICRDEAQSRTILRKDCAEAFGELHSFHGKVLLFRLPNLPRTRTSFLIFDLLWREITARKSLCVNEHLIIEGAVRSDLLFLSSPKIKDVTLEFMKGKKFPRRALRLNR